MPLDELLTKTLRETADEVVVSPEPGLTRIIRDGRRRSAAATIAAAVAAVIVVATLGLAMRQQGRATAPPATDYSKTPTPASTGPEVHWYVDIHADHSHHAESFPHLMSQSFAVVEGVVADTSEERGIALGGHTEATDFIQKVTVAVEQTLAGTFSPRTLTFDQFSRSADGRTILVNRTPPLEEGERVILFLVAERRRDGSTQIFPHPQGRVVVANGRIIPSEGGPSDGSLNGITAEELRAKVRAEESRLAGGDREPSKAAR